MIDYHLYDGNRVYTETVEVDEKAPLPMNGTSIEPPDLAEGEMARWLGGVWEIITELPAAPDPEPAPPPPPPPTSIVAQARFHVDGFDVSGINGQSGIAAAYVFDVGLVYCEFKDALPWADYIVTPKTEPGYESFVALENQSESGFILCLQTTAGDPALPAWVQLIVSR